MVKCMTLYWVHHAVKRREINSHYACDCTWHWRLTKWNKTWKQWATASPYSKWTEWESERVRKSNQKIKWQSLYFRHKLFLPNEFHSVYVCSPSVSVVHWPVPEYHLHYINVISYFVIIWSFILCQQNVSTYDMPSNCASKWNKKDTRKLLLRTDARTTYPTRYMLIWVLSFLLSLLSLFMMSHPININNHTRIPPTQYFEKCPMNK